MSFMIVFVVEVFKMNEKGKHKGFDGKVRIKIR